MPGDQRSGFVSITLILTKRQKEDELLKLLKISHEESLKIIEDYQRREGAALSRPLPHPKTHCGFAERRGWGSCRRQLGEEKTKTLALEAKIKNLETGKTDQTAPPATATPAVPRNIAQARHRRTQGKSANTTSTYEKWSGGK